MSQGWESRAQDWLAWARTPGHDAYWHYRDAFFALLEGPVPLPKGPVPLPKGPVPLPKGPDPLSKGSGPLLEVGCGEGRVARDLAARGYAVTALDASPTLLAAARERDTAGTYVLGAAEALPFADGSFPLVVAYNSLMDVDDMPRAIAEIGRVLAPGGALCFCVTHPLADVGRFDGERFVIDAGYLESSDLGPIHDEKDGLTMVWDGRRHPLHAYASALESAGLAIEALREPSPAADAPAHYDPWRRIPMFLMVRASRTRA